MILFLWFEGRFGENPNRFNQLSSAPLLRTLLFFLFLTAGFASVPARAESFQEAPRVLAALEQGRAAEEGKGFSKNLSQAVALYCDAATMGSPEGFYRIGRLLATAPVGQRNQRLANAYLALAISLGNQDAHKYFDPAQGNAELGSDCAQLAGVVENQNFNVDAYLAKQAPAKIEIARLIRQLAPKYNVDPRLALAIAMTESNLTANAVSPKNAQGVMQLIPATQERFGVTRPFNAEQNIRGAMAYLRWLDKRFAGDWRLVAAAYNAGEGSVDRYGGIPPYAETQQYVRRVMGFAGAPVKLKI